MKTIFLFLLSITLSSITTFSHLVAEESKASSEDNISEESSQADRNSQLQAVLFRVLTTDGKPIDGAEVRIRVTNTSIVKCPKDRCRGRTVNGLFQTFVSCVRLKGAPPQIRFEYEIWSALGKTARGFWWNSPGSWQCNQTREINVKLVPLDHVDIHKALNQRDPSSMLPTKMP